jgi:hypothetical protein
MSVASPGGSLGERIVSTADDALTKSHCVLYFHFNLQLLLALPRRKLVERNFFINT